MTTTKNKKAAIMEFLNSVMPNSDEAIKEENIKKIAKKYGISANALMYAVSTFLNFGKIDLRLYYSNRRSNSISDELSAKLHQYKVEEHIPHKDYTTKELILFFHEYYFGTSVKSGEFRRSHNISNDDWFDMHRLFKITGKIGDKQILDFTKYSKPLNLKAALVYAKYITKYNKGDISRPLAKSYKNKSKYLRSLTKTDEEIIRRLVKVLYFYTLDTDEE